MFKFFRRSRIKPGDCFYGFRVIRSAEDPNTVYIEAPDGLRVIFRNGIYDGWYVA